MTELISLLVPTRGRPAQCASMWRSAIHMAVEPDDVELVLYFDLDDPEERRYTEWLGCQGENVVNLTGPRIILSETWNRCAETAAGEILWHGNDDVIFRSEGWDKRVREAFRQVPDRIALVHGRDGIHDGGMATLGFLHRRWVETTGYFVPPYFSSDYNDTWNSQVADMLGRRVFLPEVYTEHMHPAVGKAELDQTHRERLTRHSQDNVDALYASLQHERVAWADRLRQAML